MIVLMYPGKMRPLGEGEVRGGGREGRGSRGWGGRVEKGEFVSN